ncbi:PCP reductase family protein [Candidatus Poribacteria bacterium]|nr:PCP reductase family protein [Candidatus Poribacteria bacterium]
MVRSQLQTGKEDSVPNITSQIEGSETAEGGKCPFTSVISEAYEEESEPETDGLSWTQDALERLERIPSFVRPMAKMGIESYAKDNGHTEINAEVMDQARGNFPAQF